MVCQSIKDFDQKINNKQCVRKPFLRAKTFYSTETPIGDAYLSKYRLKHLAKEDLLLIPMGTCGDNLSHACNPGILSKRSPPPPFVPHVMGTSVADLVPRSLRFWCKNLPKHVFTVVFCGEPKFRCLKSSNNQTI